jgi:hypothetical protein
MDALQAIEAKYLALSGRLDEATLRLWVATEARSLGRGGVSLVAKAAGVSRTTIYAGLAELEAASMVSRQPGTASATVSETARRVRAAGGGRKKLIDLNPGLLESLDALVEPTSRGDPMSPLRWTCKSTARLAEELTQQAHPIGAWTVGALLRADGYSLQSNRKTK